MPTFRSASAGPVIGISRATATFCLRAGDPYAVGRHVYNHPNAAAALGAPVKFAAPQNIAVTRLQNRSVVSGFSRTEIFQ